MSKNITRIPTKYSKLIQTIGNESAGKIRKKIMGGDIELDEQEKMFYELFATDIDAINKKAGDGPKGGRPKKTASEQENKPKVIKKDKPKVIEKQKPMVSTKPKPNTIQYNTIQYNTVQIRIRVEEENLTDFLPPPELEKFLSYRSETIQHGKFKGKEKRVAEKTRDTKKRMQTRARNAKTEFGRKEDPDKTDRKREDKSPQEREKIYDSMYDGVGNSSRRFREKYGYGIRDRVKQYTRSVWEEENKNGFS